MKQHRQQNQDKRAALCSSRSKRVLIHASFVHVMERDRGALVDAVQLLHNAAAGTAAAELMHVRDQLASMHADMQALSQQFQLELDRLSQYADALQRRLNAAAPRQRPG
jgi:esterase/lipase superfamily enzyme